jgi:hypothetical protein
MKDIDSILHGVKFPTDKEISKETQAQAVSKANKLRVYNSQFKENVRIANAKTRQTPDWQQAQSQKNKRLAKTKEWQEATKAGAKKRSDRAQWLKENDPAAFRRYMGTLDEHTTETKKQMSASGKARWRDANARKAHSERLKGIKKPKVKCEYCSKEMSSANLHRYGHVEGLCQKK